MPVSSSSYHDVLVCSCEITLTLFISGDEFARTLPFIQRFQEVLLTVVCFFFLSVLCGLQGIFFKNCIYMIYLPSQGFD